jgi:DNA-binding NarL/FixJ family response regulator
MQAIKYAIADDHTIFRQGLRYALADDKKLKITGEAANGVELLKIIEKQQPDVVLLDLKMPEMDGIETTKQLHTNYPRIKILMLTTYDDEHLILHLIELGANGYLLKNADPGEIKKAIYTVYENDYYFNDLMNNALLRNITRKPESGQKETIKLNSRETEVLKLICMELTTAEIAEKVCLSPRTVEGIRTSLIEKSGVKNIAGLVLFAIKNGIVS